VLAAEDSSQKVSGNERKDTMTQREKTTTPTDVTAALVKPFGLCDRLPDRFAFA
jgi:hypothetical protein